MPRGHEQDLSALLQQGTREFQRLYERHAYRIYNLCLRITCERDAAIAGAERTFLAHAAHPESQEDPLQRTVAVALAEAPDAPSPGGAGEADAERLLRALARLEPAPRAAVALAGMGHGSDAEIAHAMGVSGESAAELRERSLEAFAGALGTSRLEAEAANGGWLWAEPPAELWQGLYPKLYTALQRELSSGGGARGWLERLRFERAPRMRAEEGASGRRGLPRLALVWLILLAGAGVAVANYAGGGESGGAADPPPPADGGAADPVPGTPPGGSAYGDAPESRQPAGPSEEELADLEAEFERQARAKERKQGRRGEQGKRRRASEPDELDADERRRAEERLRRFRSRQRSLLERRRRREERERRDEQRDSEKAPDERKGERPRDGDSPKREAPAEKAPDQKDDAPPTREEAEKNCLYDPEKGTYICPQ